MRKEIVHEWRDWLLRCIGDDNYELIKKDTLEVFTFVAEDRMDAENKSQLIIKNKKEEPV